MKVWFQTQISTMKMNLIIIIKIKKSNNLDLIIKLVLQVLIYKKIADNIVNNELYKNQFY